VLEDLLLPAVQEIDAGDAAAVSRQLARFPESFLAKMLIDNACWTLRAAAAGKPLWQLLGGQGNVEVSWCVTRQPPEAMAREAAEIVRDLQEANPMLGTRGVRLAFLYPQIYEMQVRAVIAAAAEASEAGDYPHVEIMIPLVAYETELRQLREHVVNMAEEARRKAGNPVPYSVGTMIELPRACLIAGNIARHADFFSFGTNDLTQTTIGLSRDDVEGSFMPSYLAGRIIDRSPFEVIDGPGVGELVRIGAERGREANPELKLGICGEHGGDPTSIRFFDSIGLDYVSCSPYRTPVARVAAAQAAITARAA